MQLAPLDWVIVIAYAVFAVVVGTVYARRAGKNVDEFFLTGRTLPWWVAGTSMVATTFAADTPLVVTGWVRDHGIWKNWLWWCFAVGGFLTVFLFARLWRRGGVMTTAELAELRYGGRDAAVLRGFLGIFHAGVTNTITLCWVLLAAVKIMDVLLNVDKETAVVVACVVSLSYSLLSGLWGVVVTDMVQFTMAMVGAIWLAVLAWAAIGGAGGLAEHVASGDVITEQVLAFVPSAGPGGPMDGSFWTVPIAALAVYMGLAWWAKDGVDGGGVVVQRLAASRDEGQGLKAALWYNLANYALRPWPWIIVAVASLVVFPPIEVHAPTSGTVTDIDVGAVVVRSDGADGAAPAGTEVRVSWDSEAVWSPLQTVEVGDELPLGAVVAATDSERAYPAMMVRFLPVGILGLVVASLLAAFMSTIDTHVNLASSFFVNDVYRRFLAPGADSGHYVLVARLASVGVMILAGLMAYAAESIADLFTFFLSFLGGVGPVYVARWVWWRVRASTEITAMIASSVTTVVLTFWETEWHLGALSPGGELSHEGRLVLVVLISGTVALLSLLLVPRPDPAKLVDFYRRVRPLGWWGPVAALTADVNVVRESGAVITGVLGGLALTYGLMFGLGAWLLDKGNLAAWGGLSMAGAVATWWAVCRLAPARRASAEG